MNAVIVCSRTKLFDAIKVLAEREKPDEIEYQMLAPVLVEFFLNAPESEPLFTKRTTQLFCFQLETFNKQFGLWVAAEKNRKPNHKERIDGVHQLVVKLFQSDWLVENNLVVRESLEPQEMTDQLALFQRAEK